MSCTRPSTTPTGAIWLPPSRRCRSRCRVSPRRLPMHDDSSGHEHLSSRRLFLGGALGAAGLVAAGGAGFGIARADNTEPEPDATAAVPFYGVHQAGIATAQQDRLAF